MNVLIMASLIALAVLGLGFLLMAIVVRVSHAVVQNQADIERQAKEKKTANPKTTAGHTIVANASVADQLKQALTLSAKRAAALPRGGNLGIGRADTTDARQNKKVSSLGVATDPTSAVKIAEFHTWQGLQYTPPSAAPARPAAPPARPTAVAPSSAAPAVTLIEITDDMSPADKRKAIIANAKAQAAAAKLAKADGGAAPATEELTALGAPAPRPQPMSVAPPDIAPPVLIEVTEAMSPAEKRKAIIENAKAQSAYSKALKAAGYAPASAEERAGTAPEVEMVSAEIAPPPITAPAADVPPPPRLIAITPGMDPAALRQARINNSKTLSAYRKQLKELGIDPQSVNIEEP